MTQELDLPMKERVNALAQAMMELPQADCPVRHIFAPGMYARELTIPQGVVLVGAVHKTENLAVLSAGKLRLVTESGTVEISAPYIVTVKAGSQNAAYAIETAVWTNFFPTDETDPDKLVELLTELKADEVLGRDNNPQVLANKAAQKIEA